MSNGSWSKNELGRLVVRWRFMPCAVRAGVVRRHMRLLFEWSERLRFWGVEFACFAMLQTRFECGGFGALCDVVALIDISRLISRSCQWW
jgi:hypothetical protein